MPENLRPSIVEVKRVPTEKPPFTLGDIRRAIPQHCWEKSTIKSFAYLGLDVLVCTALWVAATYIPLLPQPLTWLAWPLYWFWQGAFATGIWVLAHECGHGAFSNYNWINDGVGLLFHSLLLVPYFSWKHSHRRHHQNTGSVTRDEVFVPGVKLNSTPTVPEYKSPAYRLLRMTIMLTLGWPLYLTFNATGHYYERWANHFDPSSPIFKGRERFEVAVSDAALLAVVSGLGWLARTYGFTWLLCMYIIPYLVVNHWLVMITYLQHTHPHVPHYDDKEWDWLRGALATVDRSYGILDTVFHHIADTHVAHHLFSFMPHYHAQEATEAIKKVVGEYYARDTRPVFKALWEDYAVCDSVSPDKQGQGVFWFVPEKKQQ